MVSSRSSSLRRIVRLFEHQHSMVSRERTDGRTTSHRDELKAMLGGRDD